MSPFFATNHGTTMQKREIDTQSETATEATRILSATSATEHESTTFTVTKQDLSNINRNTSDSIVLSQEDVKAILQIRMENSSKKCQDWLDKMFAETK